MQVDMHYYGTYAIARFAGFNVEKAEKIAYFSHAVDSFCCQNKIANNDEKNILIPFVFLPGGEGSHYHEKILCQKDSKISQEMFANHIKHAKNSRYGLQLVGIACKVFLDTFSNYGFSGINSSQNKVDRGSIKLINVKNPKLNTFITDSYHCFTKKQSPSLLVKFIKKIALTFNKDSLKVIGQYDVATLAEYPFLHWAFYYEDNEILSERNNPEDFLEGCEKLYEWLILFGKAIDENHTPVKKFSEVKEIINTTLRTENKLRDRVSCWRNLIEQKFIGDSKSIDTLEYDLNKWQKQNSKKTSLKTLSNLDCNEFNQAVIYHYNFVLKELLPKYAIDIDCISSD